MRRLHLLALTALTAVAALASVGSAQAAPTDPFQYKTTFGEGSSGNYESIAANQQSGNVLVVGGGVVSQFDSSGNPVDFPAAGSNQLAGAGVISVANSGGPNQGNFYLAEGGSFRSYKADGSPIGNGANGPGSYSPEAEGTVTSLCGSGVAPNGNVWAISGKGKITELTPLGVATGYTAQLEMGTLQFFGLCSFSTDGAGHLYFRQLGAQALYKFDIGTGARLGTIPSLGNLSLRGIAVDPTNDDLYLGEDRVSLAPGEGELGSVRVVPAQPPAPAAATQVLDWTHGLRFAEGLAFDASGQTMYLLETTRVRVFHREPASPPRDLAPLQVKQVRSNGAFLESQLTAGGAPVTYRYEYGSDSSYSDGVSLPFSQSFQYFPVATASSLTGLQPGRTYHVRMVATNAAGTTYGPDATFTTYPAVLGGGLDPCANALARKQTKAQALPDCRAYELVSAANTNGYDVESYLAPGQTPFPGFPMAIDKLLYATYSGAVPGPWNATNKGPDPYLASRTANGWVTDYKGLPSDLNPAAGSFSSVLGEADSQLNTLAFAGPNLCDPCFTSGLRTGIPLRLPSGQLVQGMSGSLAGSVPDTAKPEGKVAKYFSQNGEHLIFASKYTFEPGANTGGELTVYDRNLATGTTQIVSTDDNGDPLTGTVSELDVSADGSRIVTASKLGEDAQGNEYVHPWMHTGSSPGGVDLAPKTTTGVLFAGMTSDGSRVFFTTTDKLVGDDTDASADLYEAAVDGSGNLSLAVLTGDSDSDACSPVANANGEHWNTTGTVADCSAVAIAGGGGVASASGATYFLSPESFGGKGTLNQPNLYLASGGALSFVATLEPDNPLVLDSVKASAVRRTGDFQTTPSGGYAAFASTLGLSGQSTFGFATVFRYAAGAGQVLCVSCDISETDEAGIAGNSELAPNGLSLLDDGRVFFTTPAQLANNDANHRKDIYVWSGGVRVLISGGNGPFDSGLLTVSADGTDVFFFTHDRLAPEEDQNGQLMKIYDARVGGGFFKLPPPVACQAADECHGPGTAAGSAPDVRSSGKTTPGNVLVCPKNRVKKRGQCVKKPVQRKKKQAKKRSAKKRNASTNGKRGGRNA